MSEDSDLTSAIKRASMDDLVRSIPSATPDEVDSALFYAIEFQRHDAFDLLWPRASAPSLEFSPLSYAAKCSNHYVLDRLLPTATPDELTVALRFAIFALQPTAALAIIAVLPSDYDPRLVFDRAFYGSLPSEVVRALLPFISEETVHEVLFSAAVRRPELIGDFARLPGADVLGAIDQLLDLDRSADDPVVDAVRAEPGLFKLYAGVDRLLAFVPEEARASIVAAHPALLAHPQGQAVELKRVVAEGNGSRPRM